ncbi:MAG: hypothetical protein RLZZ300_1202, partial [Pseudomonadota bacterium]
PPVVLFNQDPARQFAAHSTWTGKDGHELVLQPEGSVRDIVLANGVKGLEARFVATSPTGVQLRRTFTLARGSYALRVRDELVNTGTGTWTGDIERKLERVPPVVKSGMTNPEAFSLNGAAWWSPEDKYKKRKYPDFIEDGPLNLEVKGGWVGLSELALFYIGGIIKHAKALNAITNPGTNSYKRLVPHYEAPVKLAYSAKNRSASIRIPFVASTKARRIEARFPDPIANPYLCFAALLMAGLDGIQNKIHPGDPASKNLYDLPPEEDAQIPTVCASLEEALASLDKDREFLTKGGVFSNDWIDAYLALKMEEVNKVRMTTHPVEFDLYYSC